MQPFVIHAHFYQPDRTHPWTGILTPEPAAAPYRDWNERVHAESYRPNAFARIFDDQRRVERMVNVYERLSFDVGPTLMTWLEGRQPETYQRILDADWRSASRTGHGNAIAQSYHHSILPLAGDRDRRTQIRWGLADFRHRFGREPEGMWLPETAADRATIDALIDEGVGFTVLAAHQASRARQPDGEWRAVEAADPTRAYRHRHSDGSGRSIVVFFSDSDLARWLSFDEAAAESPRMIGRLLAAASTPGLVNAALDGETFGHHRRFGELGLAYTLFEAAGAHDLEPTNYATWLAAHPAVDEVEIAEGEGTSWSCPHGVGRWYRDCGCATGGEPGWSQAWRGPLRRALDEVAAAAEVVFEDRGGSLLRDPWAARDDYVQVLLGAWTSRSFLERHAAAGLSETDQPDVWCLLEAQRHAMAMFTSCGWFFSDIAGIEARYVLRFAARVLDLLEALGTDTGGTAQGVGELLAEAKSNRPEAGTGADVWNAVRQEAVSPARVSAHVGLLSLARQEEGGGARAGTSLSLAGHTVTLADRKVARRGRTALMTGRATVTADATGKTQRLATAVLHLGGVDFYGHVADDPGPEAFTAATNELWSAFATDPVARLIHLVDGVFGGRRDSTAFDLDWALPWAKEQLVEPIFSDLTDRFSAQYARLYHDHRRIFEMLVAAGYPLPHLLRASAELTLSAEVEEQLALVASKEADTPASGLAAFARIREILALAGAQGYHLSLAPVRQALEQAVTVATRAAARSLDPAAVALVRDWMALAGELDLEVDLSHAQEQAWETLARARAGRLGIAEQDVAAGLGALIGFSPLAWTPPGLRGG